MGTVSVCVDAPIHSGLSSCLDYAWPTPLPAGSLVRVPLGTRQTLGIVWDPIDAADAAAEAPGPARTLRALTEVWSLPPLDAGWRALVGFAAQYYQRGVGELALAVLPPDLRQIDAAGLARRLKRMQARRKKADAAAPSPAAIPLDAVPARPALTPEQQQVLAALPRQGAVSALLWGATGSGKTEVYLRAAEDCLASGRQALVMVPEINLTPQQIERFTQRFPAHRVVAMHSALTPAQRLQAWLAAHLGEADLVVGTRMAVFASLPRLGLIVVDEEHDPSYKQQEGARYSARDLAVMRGRLESVPVLLGSATPSLETWANTLPAAPGAKARYLRLDLPGRIGGGAMPRVVTVDWNQLKARHGVGEIRAMGAVSTPLRQALRNRVERGEQSLLLLNRRGYAPVLHCPACGWKSACGHCSAWRVFHKADRSLRCHHCGDSSRVPRACPDCGNVDIEPLGRGTERLEEQLAEMLPGARIARIDADTTRVKGALQSRLAEVHAGEVDVLVGTQMIAKGHDFRHITLVAAIQPDAGLFSSDFRAPERLFSLLLQAAGRAGRDADVAARSEMWLQTWNPDHALYRALREHDYLRFAQSQLEERRQAGLPPYQHLALLRAEARSQDVAQAYLADVAQRAAAWPEAGSVLVYPPVPTAVQRVADVERAQMLVEAASRGALQRFLAVWQADLHAARKAHKGLLRWAIDVDPLAI